MIENTRRPPQDWSPALLETMLPAGSAESLTDELTTMLALTAFAETDLSPALAEVEPRLA